jgi:hypothetical protein
MTILHELKEMNLIVSKNGHWVHSGLNIHVPAGSPFTLQNHLNWRLKAMDDINSTNSIHYTTLFSLSKKDWQSLRETLLEFIDRQRDTIHESGTEEMFCFCCDLYQPK